MFNGEKREPIKVILLSIVTCGIYGIWWMHTIGKEINAALGNEEVNPMLPIFALICAPISFYYIYTIDKALEKLAPTRGVSYKSNFMLWIITMLLGVGTLIFEFQAQDTLNTIWDASQNGMNG